MSACLFARTAAASRCAGEPAQGFSGFQPGEAITEAGIGPGSNTGQKGGALVDYLTVVVDQGLVEERGLADLRNLLGTIFGFQGEVFPTAIRDKRWQYYPRSAVLVDREGEMVGRVGLGDTICISLSGAGTRWVRSWTRVVKHLTQLRARITRVDVAFDDYDGECLDVHELRQMALDGEFAQGGRPPQSRFLSDEGSGKGCTLYVGAKGHKELCVYEKGKQQGMSDSKWTRAELRLYGKHAAIPLEVLVYPLLYLRGGYDVLNRILKGVATRLRTVRKQVECNAVAMVRYLKRQVGPSLNVLRQAFGLRWSEVLEAEILRDGQPGRFRGVAKGAHLHSLVREELSKVERFDRSQPHSWPATI